MNYGVNLLHYLAFLANTVHARVLHVTDIQYMFVKQNGKDWEKNATERIGMSKETLRNGTEGTANSFTSRFH